MRADATAIVAAQLKRSALGFARNDVTDELDSEVLAEMVAAEGKNRGYASFYQWPDRQVMERGIVTDFLQFATNHFPSSASSVDSIDPDPPDVAVTFPECRVGIEVTELVDQSFLEAVVHAKRAGQTVYDWSDWDGAKFAALLQSRIDAKCNPPQVHGGPYEEYVLVVHTAEPGLRPAQVSQWLRIEPVGVRGILSRAFLLFDYHPGDDTRVLSVGGP